MRSSPNPTPRAPISDAAGPQRHRRPGALAERRGHPEHRREALLRLGHRADVHRRAGQHRVPGRGGGVQRQPPPPLHHLALVAGRAPDAERRRVAVVLAQDQRDALRLQHRQRRQQGAGRDVFRGERGRETGGELLQPLGPLLGPLLLGDVQQRADDLDRPAVGVPDEGLLVPDPVQPAARAAQPVLGDGRTLAQQPVPVVGDGALVVRVQPAAERRRRRDQLLGGQPEDPLHVGADEGDPVRRARVPRVRHRGAGLDQPLQPHRPDRAVPGRRAGPGSGAAARLGRGHGGILAGTAGTHNRRGRTGRVTRGL